MTAAGAAHPFDALAARYDDAFSRTPLGERLRRASWRRLDAAFPGGCRVLELGCGTGEDATHLAARGVTVVATDPSEAMLGEARAKVAAAGLTERARFVRLAAEEVERETASLGAPFDGAFSSFGALNCVADLPAAARGLAAVLRPGTPLLLGVMGPFCLLETLRFLARGEPRRAFRRFRRGGVEWRGLRVAYPSPGELARALSPAFSVTRLGALGALLPPTEAEAWARRHPRLLDRLDRWERRLETTWPLPRVADHYLLELVRA